MGRGDGWAEDAREAMVSKQTSREGGVHGSEEIPIGGDLFSRSSSLRKKRVDFLNAATDLATLH